MTSSFLSNEHEPNNEHIMFKIVLVGDTNVGKTAIMLRFTDNVFNPNGISTIGVSWIIKNMIWRGKTVKLQIWDTAGQERFSSLAPLYCRKADAVLMCYDITNLQSFQNVDKWSVKAKIPTVAELVLVGNKIDLDQDRVITTAMGQEKAEALRPEGVRLFETSAKTNASIDEVFNYLVNHLMSMREASRLSNEEVEIVVDGRPQTPEGNLSCCRS